MEKSFENEGFDELMEKYNFDSPIEVTLIIEGEDPPEPNLLTGLTVSNERNVTNAKQTSSEISKEINSNIDKVKNKIFNEKTNCKSISNVEKSTNSILVSKTIFSEGHQEETQDIQWKLLDAVADNLIHITKCYYQNFVKNRKQMGNIEKLKLEYLTLKYYFFNLSYSTTITILLPQENNRHFLDNFINRIIKIAYRSSWFQISFKMLDKLIRDMFIWTTRKKTNLDLKFGSHNHDKGGIDCFSNTLTIRNRLNQASQNFNRSIDNGPITNYATQGRNTQPDFVSKTHLPVPIYISPNISHINNHSQHIETSPLNIRNRTNYQVKDTYNLTGNGHIIDNAEPKRTKKGNSNCSEAFHSQPDINFSPSFVQKANHGTSPITIDRINNPTQQISTTPYVRSKTNYSTKENNFSSRQALNTKTSKILLSSGPPNQKITISVDSEILANINYQNTNQLNNNAIGDPVNETYGINSFKRQKANDTSYYPYDYYNILSDHNHNENSLHYSNNNSSATNLNLPVDELCCDDSRRAGYELSNTDTVRSSISRDSGCDSPICGNIRNEQTTQQTFTDFNNEEQQTPVISHVTSMNPNAVHLNFGFCKVCSATTNNMCIGCYQEYYCSLSCQAKDWENHGYICGIR